MSGYETSFAGGEDEVAASPEFQHDSDAPDSTESEEIAKIAERPASDDVLDADDAGMTG